MQAAVGIFKDDENVQNEVTKGQIHFEGKDITDLDITGRARLGLGIAQERPPTRASRPENNAPFTYEECFAALEYYICGSAARADADKPRRLIRRHLDYCPHLT